MERKVNGLDLLVPSLHLFLWSFCSVVRFTAHKLLHIPQVNDFKWPLFQTKFSQASSLSFISKLIEFRRLKDYPTLS